jgi:diguanylate cyclase (GGDEF)-like protein
MHAPTSSSHPYRRPSFGPALWAGAAIAAVLVLAGAAQLLLVQRSSTAAVGTGAAGHADDAKAVLTAYDENLLDPIPAIRSVLDRIAAEPGVAEVALVSGEGVELTGGTAVAGAELVEGEAAPADLAGAVGSALRAGAEPSVQETVETQPLAIHDEPHALVVLREPVPATVAVTDVRRIVGVTLAAALLCLLLGVVAYFHSLSRRHARAVEAGGVDALTGLPGHRLFREELERRAGASVRRDTVLTLAVIDLDRFADLNDARGLRHGDAVLAEVGRLLAAGRADDLPYRIGPDEFAVLFPHTTAADATVAVERMRDAIAAKVPGVTVSAGVAQLDADTARSESLLAQAELALHDAKAQGRDRVVVFRRGVLHAEH